MKVAISVAHHKKAKGATYNGLNEFDISAKISSLIKTYFDIMWDEKYIVEVIPTGKLQDKVSYINENNFDIAIETHLNACGNCGASGHEVLYYPNSKKGKKLATCINTSLYQNLGKNNRGVKEGWYRMDAPNQVDYDGDVEGDETPNYFLERTNCVAVIVEPEFIEKFEEEDVWYIVPAIAEGIVSYIKQN